MTKNELMTSTAYADDIDGFTNDIVGQEPQQSVGGAIFIKFTNEATWITARDEEEIDPRRRFLLTGISRLVQLRSYVTDEVTGERSVRFDNEKTITLAPNEPWPDVDGMNAAISRAEWIKVKFSPEPQGPWIRSAFVQLVEDSPSLDRYVWPANVNTNGHAIAVDEIVRTTRTARKLRGPQVSPIVVLSDTFMNTRFGGRQRPQLTVIDWITPSRAAQPIVVPTTTTAQIEKPQQRPVDTALHVTAQGVQQTEAPQRKQFVSAKKADAARDANALPPSRSFFAGERAEYPSLNEELNDKVPF
jgi:hypothetical protein